MKLFPGVWFIGLTATVPYVVFSMFSSDILAIPSRFKFDVTGLLSAVNGEISLLVSASFWALAIICSLFSFTSIIISCHGHMLMNPRYQLPTKQTSFHFE